MVVSYQDGMLSSNRNIFSSEIEWLLRSRWAYKLSGNDNFVAGLFRFACIRLNTARRHVEACFWRTCQWFNIHDLSWQVGQPFRLQRTRQLRSWWSHKMSSIDATRLAPLIIVNWTHGRYIFQCILLEILRFIQNISIIANLLIVSCKYGRDSVFVCQNLRGRSI